MKTIGVIGIGSIGMRHKTNLWKHLGQTEVISYDPDPEKQNGTGWVIGDIGKMIEMSDAIIIASPTNLHQRHYMNVVIGARDIPVRDIPVFVEKPIAHIRDDMMKNVVMVGYNLRFHSCVKKAKEWIDAGSIGRPLWANFTLAQWNDKPAYLRDGVILNWSHEIDLALYLLGDGSVAHSSTRLSDGNDDLTDILLTHENGCRSSIHLDYITKPEQRGFTIAGTLGVIHADLVARKCLLEDARTGEEWTFTGSDSWDSNYIEEMKAFLDRIDGKQTLGCTGEEALKVLNICLEVRKQAGL